MCLQAFGVFYALKTEIEAPKTHLNKRRVEQRTFLKEMSDIRSQKSDGLSNEETDLIADI
jgi:hypothetical protein